MLTLLVVGRTGNGRSSVCNTILWSDSFAISDPRNPQKNETRAVVDTVFIGGNNLKIAVVDTVGIGDTDVSDVKSIRTLTISAFEGISAKLSQAMAGDQSDLRGDKRLSKGKEFDAFIFVLKFGIRFTKQERAAVLIAKSIYGESIFKKWGILVFSYGDNFESKDEDQEAFMAWCRQQTGAIKELFQEVSYRCVLFDNRSNRFERGTDNKTFEKQRNELLTQIKQQQQSEKTPKYNIDDFENNLFERSRHHYQRMINQFDEFLLASGKRKLSLKNKTKQSIQEYKQYLMDEKTEWSKVNYNCLLNSYLRSLDGRFKELEKINENIESESKLCVLS